MSSLHLVQTFFQQYILDVAENITHVPQAHLTFDPTSHQVFLRNSGDITDFNCLTGTLHFQGNMPPVRFSPMERDRFFQTYAASYRRKFQHEILGHLSTPNDLIQAVQMLAHYPYFPDNFRGEIQGLLLNRTNDLDVALELLAGTLEYASDEYIKALLSLLRADWINPVIDLAMEFYYRADRLTNILVFLPYRDQLKNELVNLHAQMIQAKVATPTSLAFILNQLNQTTRQSRLNQIDQQLESWAAQKKPVNWPPRIHEEWASPALKAEFDSFTNVDLSEAGDMQWNQNVGPTHDGFSDRVESSRQKQRQAQYIRRRYGTQMDSDSEDESYEVRQREVRRLTNLEGTAPVAMVTPEDFYRHYFPDVDLQVSQKRAVVSGEAGDWFHPYPEASPKPDKTNYPPLPPSKPVDPLMTIAGSDDLAEQLRAAGRTKNLQVFQALIAILDPEPGLLGACEGGHLELIRLARHHGGIVSQEMINSVMRSKSDDTFEILQDLIIGFPLDESLIYAVQLQSEILIDWLLIRGPYSPTTLSKCRQAALSVQRADIVDNFEILLSTSAQEVSRETVDDLYLYQESDAEEEAEEEDEYPDDPVSDDE